MDTILKVANFYVIHEHPLENETMSFLITFHMKYMKVLEKNWLIPGRILLIAQRFSNLTKVRKHHLIHKCDQSYISINACSSKTA